jgi:hypothetical protein
MTTPSYSSRGLFIQAMGDASQVVSAANSGVDCFITTGSLTAARQLTITRTPVSGSQAFVQNNCTDFGITVKFDTGAATGLIAPGASALVVADGTNANILINGMQSSSALTTTAWFVSFVSGSNSNDGLTLNTPIKTFAELFRRWGGPVVYFSKVINPGVTITVLDHDVSDTITGKEIHCLGGTSVTFQGGPALTVSTGSYTSVTAKNITTNVAPQIIDTTVSSWTHSTRKRTTSGPRLGNVDWVLKDLGSGAARCTDAAVNGVITLHQVGDAYAVETLPRMYINTLQIFSENILGPSPSFFDLDLAFASNAGPQGNFRWVIKRSRIGTYGNGFFNIGPYSGLSISSALFDSIQVNYTDLGGTISGGSASGGYGVPGSGHGCILGFAGTTQVGNFIGQNWTWILGIGSSNRVTNIANFDAVADAANPNGDGMMIGISLPTQGMCVLQINGGQIWGSGSAGHGLAFDTNAVLSYVAGTFPTIAGARGDFRLGPSLTSDAMGVFVDGVSGAMSLPLSCSWTNLAALQPLGFGGNAHNIAKNIHVIARSTAPNTASLAPTPSAVLQGTQNTQQRSPTSYLGTCRTTDAVTPVTLLTIPANITGSIITISLTANGRCVTGTVGDGYSKQDFRQFKNVGGTVTPGTSGSFPAVAFDVSMASCVLSASISSTNVLIQTLGLAGVTIDWTGLASVLTS